MPTLATTVMELREAELLFKVAGALDDSDASSSDEETADMVRLAACEPLMRRRLQNIGPERLSLARLQRDYAARGFDDLDVCTEVTRRRLEVHVPSGGLNGCFNTCIVIAIYFTIYACEEEIDISKIFACTADVDIDIDTSHGRTAQL